MTDAPIDAQAAFTGTVAPEGADKLDEAKLTAWFEANVAGLRFYERLGGAVVERCLEEELPAPPETYILRVFWSDLAAMIA
jgi:hypothetical protein